MLLKKSKILLSSAYKSGYKDVPRLSLSAARQYFKKDPQPLPKGVSITDTKACFDGHRVPIRIYTPLKSPYPIKPLVCHFHGGGFVFGCISDSDDYCSNIAINSGYIVVSVDYRLAPEHRFPSALEDAICVLKWLIAAENPIEYDRTKIVVSGESSGGNLAANISNIFGADVIKGQILICPSLDYFSTYQSKQEFASGYLLDNEFRAWLCEHYLSSEEQRKDPRVSPALAKNLAAISSSLIICAEYDPLHDEAVAYGQRLSKLNPNTTVKVFNGVVHGFINYPRFFDCVDEAYQAILSKLLEITSANHERSQPEIT